MKAKHFPKNQSRGFSRLTKSILDRLVAAIALILLSPLILIVAIAIYFSMGSPVIFAQPRGGKDSCVFTFYKFRTMTDECDSHGNLLPDYQRLTAFGQFLRQSSLDEIPQLWNVLKGDMSFVGPRPFVAEYLSLYTSTQAGRHAVRPGITGWAQINGRNTITWEEKFAFDLWYVEHWSLWLDLKILLMTFIKVFNREGIDQDKNTTMSDFLGAAQADK
jgi:lipopolysaccharide/colanic/teichoic acid biosynthesis glycosyltransferase